MNKSYSLYALMFTLGVFPNRIDPNRSSIPIQHDTLLADLAIQSSHQELVVAFNWAKEKARSYGQTGNADFHQQIKISW